MPRVRAPEWCRLLRQPSRYKVIYGGRGSGKSRNVATELLLRAAHEPLRILCCREIQKSINDSVKKLLDDRRRELEYLNITPTNFFRSTKNSITTSFGSEFLFAGLRANPEAIRSMEGIDICWVEEAQTISRESLNGLIPTIRKEVDGRKSEIWFTMNPRYADDPVYADFIAEKDPRPGTIRRRVNYDENPWFPSVLYDEMLYDMKKDRDKYSHIWEGELLKHDNAKIFKHGTDWEIGDIPEPPAGTQLRYGADWGEGKTDPTTLTRSWTDFDKRIIYVDREWWALQAEYHNVVAGFKQTMAEDIKQVIKCDSSRPAIMKFLRRGGLLAVGAKKGPGSVQDGINYLKSFKIIVNPKCKHVIDEFDHYKYKINKRTEEILNDPEDANNHCIDSLRYAHEPEMLASKNRITMPS